jgi:chromosome segregation ATPase
MSERATLLPPPLEPATLQRLADLFHGRLTEQRERQDALSRGQEDLHERLLTQAAQISKLGDKVAWLEPALRDARGQLRFLNETCKTFAARLADLEGRGDVA